MVFYSGVHRLAQKDAILRNLADIIASNTLNEACPTKEEFGTCNRQNRYCAECYLSEPPKALKAMRPPAIQDNIKAPVCPYRLLKNSLSFRGRSG